MKINNLEKIKSTGEINNKFVGLKICNNKIEFHYPETYVLSNDNSILRRDILSILRTVSLAKTITSSLSSYNSLTKNNDTFPIGAYLWIISDYLKNGKYVNQEKMLLSGIKGKINWKQTMRDVPIITSNNLIYLNMKSECNYQVDNILTEIYFYCVNKSIESIGWLYGLALDYRGENYKKNFNKKLYINVLNSEIMHTFNDNKRELLQNMLNIICGLDDNIIDTKEVIYGVDSYEYVYERMIDSMFSNVANIKEFYPSANWYLDIDGTTKNSSKLRPDTVIIRSDDNGNKYVYILDAKYYRYGTTFNINDIPETTSIQKQITYGEYVNKVKEGQFKNVYSAFVMPYSKITNKYNYKYNKNIEYMGTANAQWVDSKAKTSRNIVGILIDTNFLINNWIRKDMDNINEIIKVIEEHVDKQ